MKWGIITDSSCDGDLFDGSVEGIPYTSVPFIIHIDGKDFIDDENLDRAEMVDAMEASSTVCSTGCPAPGTWATRFKERDASIAITISAQLSGSYSSAMAAREMVLRESPEKKIFVLNSRSTGPVLVSCVEKAAALINEGFAFEEVATRLEEHCQNLHTVFSLCSFNNLVKNGRMSRLAGFVAGKLHVWGIGIGSPEGTIKMKDKARGSKRAIGVIIRDMRERGFGGKEVLISHCQNPEFASSLREQILETWKTAAVRIMETRGLCSFYAERHGIIVSY